MAQAKLNKRTVDALVAPKAGQAFVWDTEIKGFGFRIGPTGTKTFVIQYMSKERRIRRVKIGRFGVITVDQARDLAKIKLGEVAAGEDPAEEARRARKEMTVAELCDWYLTKARAGRILGRRNRPIKEASLAMDESRIKTHIKPLLGKRIARHLTIADVEGMQDDVKNRRTAKGRSGGRGGKATGGPGVAARCRARCRRSSATPNTRAFSPSIRPRGPRSLLATSGQGASVSLRSKRWAKLWPMPSIRG